MDLLCCECEGISFPSEFIVIVSMNYTLIISPKKITYFNTAVWPTPFLPDLTGLFFKSLLPGWTMNIYNNRSFKSLLIFKSLLPGNWWSIRFCILVICIDCSHPAKVCNWLQRCLSQQRRWKTDLVCPDDKRLMLRILTLPEIIIVT